MSTYPTPPPDEQPDRPYAPSEPITAAQVDTIVHAFQTLEWSSDQTATWLATGWGVRRVRQLSQAQAAQVTQTLVQVLAAWAAEDASNADFDDLPPVLGPTAPVTQVQVDELEALRQAAGMNDFHWKNFLLKHWRTERARSLTQDQFTGARQLLRQRAPAGGVGQGRPTP